MINYTGFPVVRFRNPLSIIWLLTSLDVLSLTSVSLVGYWGGGIARRASGGPMFWEATVAVFPGSQISLFVDQIRWERLFYIIGA